jgi:transglutaminase-like putative cysteine protease
MWIALLALSIGMGHVIQNGLKIAQSQLEVIASTLFEQMMWRNRNPDKTRTAFGSIGKLKLSDQIHVRVQSDEILTAPLLLREASYTKFGFGLWRNDDSAFESVDPTIEKEWIFDESGSAAENTTPKNKTLEKYTISAYFKADQSIIPIPHGTYKINNVPATEAELNQFGAVNLEMKPGWVRYDAYFDDEMLGEAPGKADLTIHTIYQPTLTKLVNQLDLRSKTPNEIIHTAEQFFRNNFSYSLAQYRHMKGKNRLDDFLYHRREGHCEYFATATTLLLRAAGIPTRYAVGYSIQEYSSLEKQYIARARDAHSWTIAYVDDEWIVVDNTPSSWVPIESADESWWQPISDLWSWLAYSISIWRDYSKEQNNFAIQIMLILVIIYFFWRLFTDSRFVKIRQSVILKKIKPSVPGFDSPLYKLTEQLEKQGVKRLQGETLITWLLRQENNYERKSLLTLLDLHYRYRFDPVGLTTGELEGFEDHVVRLLDTSWPTQD